MSFNDEYSRLIEARKEYTDDIDYDTNPVIKEMVKLLTRDISETINFLETECTANQFVWMSELFDEVAEETKSKEFIKTLYRMIEKYPEESKEYNLKFFVDSAAEYV
ncbi:MAG: hypothetical protein K5767_00090 [Clostridia bacterium]|nr:hypothetical protein [Clostridia bacterium]